MVVIVLGFEALDVFFYAYTCGDGKGSDVILSVFCFSDEVRKAVIGLARGFLPLLPQEMKGSSRFGIRCIFVNSDRLIANVAGWEEPENGFRLQPFFVDDLPKHASGVIVELLCFHSNDLVLENGREFTLELPAGEKRSPVNEFSEVFQAVVIKYRDAQLFGGYSRSPCPVGFKPVGSGFIQGKVFFVGLPVATQLAYAVVIFADVQHVIAALAFVFIQKITDYGHTTGGIQYMDYRA